MGNFIGYYGDVHTQATKFIEDHPKEWAVILNKVRLGRMLKAQSYLDDANLILAPLVERAGFGINGNIEVARELWTIIRDNTEYGKDIRHEGIRQEVQGEEEAQEDGPFTTSTDIQPDAGQGQS